MALTWLYLRPCNVDHDDLAIEVALSSGETRRVKLTDYQGLHDKKQIIAEVPEQRDAIYATAAARLIDLMSEAPRPRGPNRPVRRATPCTNLPCG